MLETVDSLILTKTSCITCLSDDDVSVVTKTMRRFVKDELHGIGLDFSAWGWSHAEHIGIFLGMMAKQGLVRDSATLQSIFEFTSEIADNYEDNPYHCFLHAVDMTYMTYYLLIDMGIKEQLDLLSIDTAAILLAAISHDALHPGTNNLFQVNSNTDVAKLYQNQSVLENHSLSLCRRLLTTKYTFLSKLHYDDIPDMSEEDIIDSILDIISDSILKTDMVFHFTLLEQITTFSEAHEAAMVLLAARSTQLSPSRQEPDLLKASLLRNFSESKAMENGIKELTMLKMSDSSEMYSFQHSSYLRSSSWMSSDCSVDALPKIIIRDNKAKQIMLSAILHAADISNPARPFKLCKQWSDLVVQEFFNQGDLEQKHNLPRTPNMDRASTNQAQIQTAFTDFIVRPYFETLADMFPRMVTFTDIIHENSREWDALLPGVMSDSIASPESLGTLGVDLSYDGTYSSLPPLGVGLAMASAAAISIKRKISFEEPGQRVVGGAPSGRRLSIAAGTVDIPDSIDRIFNRLRTRNHSSMTSSSASSIRQALRRSPSPNSIRASDHMSHTGLCISGVFDPTTNLEEQEEFLGDIKGVSELRRLNTRQRRIVSMPDASASSPRRNGSVDNDDGNGVYSSNGLDKTPRRHVSSGHN
ncbi:hypothetical protein BASA50_009123 [Batrachochytrium salamandrivorans]|uniref:PDEase domain-containing protein n=1 Tax=Batrachochytrium salamandrivorans TaxID=1357716 RepID=A0ABQ8F2W4_9FUNG|nr:hypothetical protein BASA60_006300 [Batrachochytrium salamandrivorans]KAH6577810.1 hypothetical protein BASA62_000680 [Batrachochytrium salamandrivorans]KAH6578778.1 hypothetical protein BASA61_000007 [Batrachochytrium salamandrivorans]KAH6591121.1 hypothetical protein BASA50_009123 [Batrachochytrium salamandrivorans]KAH9247313.1 hypothetical protein BASA81_015080 [Batrachochytrium salamandrivorans]